MALPVQKILTVVHSAWRFRWAALLAAWVVAMLGWAAVLAIPGRYDTSAQVYVDTSTLLRPLLQDMTVSPSTNNQVDLVRQALIARPQLEKVIDSTDLKARATSAAARESLVNALGTQIRIVTDGQSRNYTITYSDSDPEVSYQVVRALLDAFVGQSVQANRMDAEGTVEFMQGQVDEFGARLTAHDSALAEFKRRHIGAMPDDRGGYYERLQSEMTDLDRLDAELSVATHSRDQLRQRLLGGGPGEGASAVSSSYDGRIAAARARVDELLLTYTDSWPEVVRLKETIKSLEAQRAVELQNSRNNPDALGTPGAGSTNLVTQQLQINLNQVDVQIASLRAQRADRERRVRELTSAIETTPKVEEELLALTRNRALDQMQYDALVRKLESARLSDQAQRSQSVDFRTISPPVVPLMPAAPDRGLLAIAVLIAALAAGGGVAYLFSLLRPVYLTSDEIRERLAGVPVIGSIGRVESPRAVRRERQAMAAFGTLAVGLVIATGVVMAGYQRWDARKAPDALELME
jgi:polysaccharide chain length determinant protein (PEP-CTERM system associated)